MTSPIRVCLVGVGRAGQVHANSLVRYVPNGKLVAFVDVQAESLRKAGDAFGVEARFDSLETALDQIEFDAVVITTPTFTHHRLTLLAANAGKHTFLEKPMALTLAECDEMIETANRKGVFIQLGFMRRFEPEFIAAEERIRSGEIGQPMMIRSLTNGPGLPPPWARDMRTSNGMLAEVNSHDWDCVRWLMASNPQRVYTEVANFKGLARGVDTPNFYDNALVNIRFESGGLGSISGICPCDYGYDARVEIFGELGIMQIGEMKGQAVTVCVDRSRGVTTPVFRTWAERFAWGYIQEMEHFVQCIHKDMPPKVDGVDGRWAVAAVLAGTQSFLENRPVYLSEVLSEGKNLND